MDGGDRVEEMAFGLGGPGIPGADRARKARPARPALSDLPDLSDLSDPADLPDRPDLVDLLTNGVEGLLGGKFYVEDDPDVAASAIIAKVNEKRANLGWPT